MEYLSYVVSKENKTVAEEFDKIAKYHLNDDVVSKTLYCDGLSQGQFAERLFNVICPVYKAAKDNGFKVWAYEETA